MPLSFEAFRRKLASEYARLSEIMPSDAKLAICYKKYLAVIDLAGESDNLVVERDAYDAIQAGLVLTKFPLNTKNASGQDRSIVDDERPRQLIESS